MCLTVFSLQNAHSLHSNRFLKVVSFDKFNPTQPEKMKHFMVKLERDAKLAVQKFISDQITNKFPIHMTCDIWSMKKMSVLAVMVFGM